MAQPKFMEDLGRVNSAKERIKQALIRQGKNAGNNIEDYADLIDSIEGSLTPQEYEEVIDLANDILGIESSPYDENESPLNEDF